MRYVMALAVACTLLGLFVVNHWWVEDTTAGSAETAPQSAATHPDGSPAEAVPAIDKDIARRIEIDRFFIRYWLFITPLVLGLCFGAAFLIPRAWLERQPPK